MGRVSNAAAALTLLPVTLVIVLVVSAVAKLRAPASTASAVRLLRLPRWLGPGWVAKVLPPAEILLGLAMLSPWLPLARLAAIGAVLLFLVYWAIVARAMTFDPRPSCGCFGQIGDQRVTAKTLARNTVLLAGAAAFVWMTWAHGVTVFSFVAEATTREWLLLLGAGYAVLVAWFVLSPPAPVKQRRRDRGTHADAEPTADADDEYVRVPIPDAVLLDGKRDAATLLQLAGREAVLLVFVTCACPSTHETWQRLRRWDERLPQVRVLGVETYQLGDLGVEGVAERLYYDPAARAYAALKMPGTSSAVLLGADGLIAGGPVLGTAEVEALVDEIAEALAAAEPSVPAPAPAPLD
jgi:hypothetical protein